MELNDDTKAALEWAQRWAALKRQAHALLAQLAPEDQQRFVAQLFTELPVPVPAVATRKPRSLLTVPLEVKNGRLEVADHKEATGRSKTELLLDALKERPRAPIAHLAKATYNSASTEALAKTRSLLAALKKRGRVRATGKPGEYEVGEE